VRTFKEELLLRLLPLSVPQNVGTLTGDSKATGLRREAFIKEAKENAERMVLFADVCDQVVNPRNVNTADT
jgi:hypothetical protein